MRVRKEKTAKIRDKKKTIAAVLGAVIIVAVVLIVFISGSADPVYAVPAASIEAYSSDYQAYLTENGYDGSMAASEIALDLENYTADASLEAEIGQDGILTGDEGTITWSFNVTEEGFYNIELGYIPLPGTTSDIQRQILIDGESPYSALEQIVLKRTWQDDEIVTKNDNEIRPSAEEIYEEKLVYIEEDNRRTSEALKFYLTKGEHTITFSVVKEPVEYTSITFKKQEDLSSYETVYQEWTDAGLTVYEGETLIGQAERTEGATTAIYKSSTAINIKKNYTDSAIEPYHPWNIIYNTIGGDSWKLPGDSITWEIEVAEEGLYTLTFKGRQSTNRGVTSYRRLYVNGEVPFEEMNAVGFDYSNDMQNYTVANSEGESYYFYLKEGSNTITLENVLGSFGNTLNEVEESMAVLNQMYLQVITLTGQSPDRYIDYEIAKKIPEFAETMKAESERLYRLIDELVEITGERGENTSLLQKMAVEAEWLSEDPERVVTELGQFKSNISSLATWTVQISEMPLELDSIILSGTEQDLPEATAGTLTNLKNSVLRFASTFFVDTSTVSASSNEAEDGEDNNDTSIKVWMASSGREQAQMIQNMIDETFTPEMGINVDLQLIPVDVVLRAALAGNGPDVVIGLPQSTMQDFAMRGAITDLSQFDDFDEVTEKYYQSTLDVASYQGGTYGIPEQASVMMLFYRTDVLEAIGAEVPTTWSEVKQLIPLLQKHNYDFYLPSAGKESYLVSGANTYTKLYQSMVFQYGGDVYLGEGNDYGISTGLGSDEAMQAFKDYTDLFTSYGLEVTVDFSNRFRTGEMPVGIIDYTTYCQLEIFAPEIKGLWEFTVLPGYENEDGTIDHTYAVETVQSVIMASKNEQDASWEFVKWFNSTDTQLSYANTLESVMGTSARYPAADPEVLKQLPWSNSELTVLLDQLENTVGISAVPGYYMTTRMVQYAFNDVVADLSSPRETLYLNLSDINIELTKKRQEFGLNYEE